ncbi:unnamed protein product [Calypogeia fissa]
MGVQFQFRGYGDVLMIPTGLKGHIDPMIYLAKRLATYGLTSTVVIQEDLQSFVAADIEEKVEGLIIQVVPPAFVHFPVWATANLAKACDPYFNKLLADRESGAPVPKCIIADMLQGWTQEWADKLQTPRYVSCPSPAAFGLVMNNFSALLAKGLLRGRDPNPALNCPGTPNLHLSDLPPIVRTMPKFMYENGDTFKDSAGMLVNTLYDLEARAIDTFQAEMEGTSKREKVTKMYPIGPLLPAEYFSLETFHGAKGNSETIQWLNTRSELSVLYVAFGSIACLEPRQVVELAHGLEVSQVSFLWILPPEKPKDGSPHANVDDHLPSGFRERTKDRGLVFTEFAPQLQILSHPATGGFLTHCGWNSCLESICRGVPMLAWPMHAEQGLNCRILVDEANVAIEIKKGPGGAVERGAVENGVRGLMMETVGKRLKERVLELQRQAREAISPGGSSHRNLESLVKEIQGSRMLQIQ